MYNWISKINFIYVFYFNFIELFKFLILVVFNSDNCFWIHFECNSDT